MIRPPAVASRAHVGDVVLLASSGHVCTSPDRSGVVVDLLGERGDRTYLVRWSDGRLSAVPPGAVQVRRGGHR